MKKKFVGTVLALSLMTFTLTACGDDTKNQPTTSTETTTEATTGETTTAETTTEATTTTGETSSEETTTDTNSSASSFSTGTWDGNIFTNAWLNLKFTFPENSSVATEEQIKQVVGAGADILANNGNYTEAQLKASEFTTAYDYLVTLPDGTSNIQLMYENVSLTAPGQDITVDDYLTVVKTQLEGLADYGYQFADAETVNLGSQTFTKLPGSVMDGAMKQDYYCMKKDNYIVSLVVSYVDDSAATVQEIMDGITTAEAE